MSSKRSPFQVFNNTPVFIGDPARFPHFKYSPQKHDPLPEPRAHPPVMIAFSDHGAPPPRSSTAHALYQKTRKLAGDNPDYGTNDPPDQAEFRYNVLDMTKVGISLATLHGDSRSGRTKNSLSVRPVGMVAPNENPHSYFAEIEQDAFSPSHLVPGFEASADPVLQSRPLAYPDAHRHRLGVNY
ncbi:catalase-like domain-containing protein [Gautieria morchelliformis]|nr:catalase-like domain-containing protein [Gautieria morchelliformis]